MSQRGMISDHVIGSQNIIKFNYTYLGKVGNVANFVSVHNISATMYFALGQNKVTIISRVPTLAGGYGRVGSCRHNVIS